MNNTRGYVILAVNEIEYKHAAYAAYSIKSKMPDYGVSLVVPNIKKVKSVYLESFNELIELPFKTSTNRRQNDWQLYWCTPYDSTIAIDAKSVIKEDQSTTWDYLDDHYNICFPTTIKDFRGHVINPKYQTILLEEYNYTPVYSKQFFFKKDKDDSLKYFKLADVYFQNWKDIITTFLNKQHQPEHFDSDLLHTLVANHSGIDVLSIHKNTLEYIDMKTALVDMRFGKWNRWTDRINVWASANAKLKIQNFAINSTLYYDENEFLTTEMYNEQRNFYRTTTKNV